MHSVPPSCSRGTLTLHCLCVSRGVMILGLLDVHVIAAASSDHIPCALNTDYSPTFT